MSDAGIVYKPPKGTRDYSGAEQLQRELIVQVCVDTFRLYNVEATDTPCFEMSDVLRKGGNNTETSKLTFDLVPGKEAADAEHYTLRYVQKSLIFYELKSLIFYEPKSLIFYELK